VNLKIFLTGMMGSGKSYWAKALAGMLGIQSYDLDVLIETSEERSIERIFKESGEAHFRNIESNILRSFVSKDNFIVATGGGTPCFFDNMAWMNNEGITIWLDEPIATMVKRLIPEKAHRPLIAHLSNEELSSFLYKKRNERIQFYNQSKFILKEENITEENLLSIIKANSHA